MRTRTRARPQTAGNTSAAAADAGSTSASPDVPALVGEWSRTTTCQQRADALGGGRTGALRRRARRRRRWSRADHERAQLEDPKHPCQRAVPIKHSHFFTAEGLFGSRDAEGNQVDDGSYRLVGDDRFVIGKEFEDGVTFHYRIEDGDTLYLDPELPGVRREGLLRRPVGYRGLLPGPALERSKATSPSRTLAIETESVRDRGGLRAIAGARLARMRETWTLAVFGDMKRRLAISLLL